MIHVIGLGVAVPAQLSPDVLHTLQHSDYVIGSQRQLDTLPIAIDKPLLLPKLGKLKTFLEQHPNEQICILASGDPLYYGIGRWLGKHFKQLHFYPAISSIQATCHALGLSLQDVQVVSLHGRPLLSLKRHLARYRYLLILTDQYSNPQALARLCIEHGYATSRLWVCERLGYENEQISEFKACDLAQQSKVFDPLHVTVIEVQGQGGYLPSSMGVPDHHFITDSEAGKGMLTKREVRLGILGLLQPSFDDVAWDIGAGCGGVAVEWALAQQQAHVFAIEHHEQRLDCLAQNQQRFGVVDNLNIVAGRAPDVLADLPQPNKVFIGGSDGVLPDLLQYCWNKLPEGGMLVGSAVTETTKQHYFSFANTLPEQPIETLQIATSKGSKLAGQWLYRPNLPVSLFKFIK